ncbi:hypothetical protein Bbelb_247200 [Branchiostoma belcheri]|nr:hypothetical protein Bbelb_247200 [Branchiostoma belcheri]
MPFFGRLREKIRVFWQGKVWRRNENGDCNGGAQRRGAHGAKKTRSCENPVVNFALRVSNLCRCLDDLNTLDHYQRRLDQSRPGDQRNTSSEDFCLNMTTVDWTRPGDLKTQEEYQLTAVMILNLTRPDGRVLRNLVTGNFSSVQTSKSDDLKTQCVLSVSCPNVPVLTGRNL